MIPTAIGKMYNSIIGTIAARRSTEAMAARRGDIKGTLHALEQLVALASTYDPAPNPTNLPSIKGARQ